MFRFILILSVLTLLSIQAQAQSVQVGQGRDQKSIKMVRTDTPPVIDGVLDDAVWDNAAYIDEFHQIIPVEYAESPPSVPKFACSTMMMHCMSRQRCSSTLH